MPRSLNETAATTAGPGQRPTVLIVDDDPAMRAVLARLLPLYGYPVLEAASGFEAIEVFRGQRGRIGFVLLDVCMDGMDGPTTLACLRETDAEVPVAFMTAHPGQHTRRALRERDVVTVLAKPFSVRDLLAVLAAV